MLAEGLQCIKGEQLCHTRSESQSSFTILSYQFSAGKLHNRVVGGVLMRDHLTNENIPNFGYEDGASNLLWDGSCPVRTSSHINTEELVGAVDVDG